MGQSSKNKKSVGKKIASAPGRTLKSIVSGRVVSIDFFNRHKLKFFVGFLLIIFYISTKYQCQTKMEQIRRLEERLDVVKAESIREQSRYMSRIRESSMAALADSVRPGLAVQSQPPYILKLSKD